MTDAPPAQGPLDRLASFRVVYAGILAYVVLSVAAIETAERMLASHFEALTQRAVRVNPADGSVVAQIQERLREQVHGSAWVRIGGVRVNALVLGADGRTPVYLEGRTLPPPSIADPAAWFREAERLLPVIASTQVTVPLDSLLAGGVWVGFGALLVSLLFFQQRRVAWREQAVLTSAVAARDATAERARSIQSELEKLRQRLALIEPVERAHVDEIESLQREREALQAKLAALAERETELRQGVTRSAHLDGERQALEDLLEEAVQDLDQKEREIRELQDRLKRAAKAAPGGRTRATEQLARRVRTLYRNLEIDDRAIDDIVALGDESLRLRAEEGLKKLDENPETAGVRRKVGGLPGHLSIFELGFAGKGRIYYARGAQRSFRVLAVGGKASQKTDLEYLSRLTLD
jgi:hypothetical protein